MTELEAVELIEVLTAAYPKTKIDPRTVTVYARMIEDCDRAEAEAAILYLIATETFLPAVAEVRTAIAEGRSMLPAWEEAWEKVCAARREYGSYVGSRWGREIIWDDLTAQTLRVIGGYEAVCHCQHEDEPTMRAQFRDAFNALRRRRVTSVATVGLSRLGMGRMLELGGETAKGGTR